MIFKFNNGNGAILCSECGVILASGHEIYNYINEEHIKDKLIGNDKEFFCCELCRDEYYRKKKESAIIIKH